jgi:hypothetical protein
LQRDECLHAAKKQSRNRCATPSPNNPSNIFQEPRDVLSDSQLASLPRRTKPFQKNSGMSRLKIGGKDFLDILKTFGRKVSFLIIAVQPAASPKRH